VEQEVKYRSDYQKEWTSFIPTLRKYKLEPVKLLMIVGDAPKDFVTDSEYRPGHRTKRQREESYIAKVGSKFIQMNRSLSTSPHASAKHLG
jgi:hypothetical protein